MSDERNNYQTENENGSQTEYTRSHSNREFHLKSEDGESLTPEEAAGFVENSENYDPNESEGDLYANTITGYRVSASDRKENFTDENYGATGQKTLKDIIRNTENEPDENDQ